MQLRPYQQEAHDSTLEAWKTHRSALIVVPTGGGKTIIFAHLIKSVGGRALVLVHRDELLVQAQDKIAKVTGFQPGIEKAELYADESLFGRASVVVSSIQTQISGPREKRRYTRFLPADFNLLICDEGHHAVSPSWKEVIAYYQQNPNLKTLATTATPDRADKEALGQVFETVSYDYGILDAINDGWLVDISQQFVKVSTLDYSHVRTTAGDLNEGDLAKVMEMEDNIQRISQASIEAMFALNPKTLDGVPVDGWRKFLESQNCTPRRTIVFTVSVAQAEMCANVFSRVMDGAEWVCGATNVEKRREILKRFAEGSTHVVCNCGVLLEGFDNPSVELIVMARPTKSRALYAQAVGRSTRPLAGLVDGLATAEERRAAIANSPKKYCRILDFVGNSGRHKLITCADILGGKVSEEAIERAKAKAIERGIPALIVSKMEKAEEAIEEERKEKEMRKRESEARKARLIARSKYAIKDVNPFGKSENFGPSQLTRDGHHFSEKQAKHLRKHGYDPSRFTYRQGQAILGKIFSKGTERQLRFLEKHGYGEQAKQWDMKTCSKMIDQIIANGGKRLEEPPAEQPKNIVEEYLG